MSSPWRNARRNLVEAWFSPDHEHRFALRIRLRVLRLRLRLWRRRPKAALIRDHWPKPVALLFVGILVPILTGWLLWILFPPQAEGLAKAVSNLTSGPSAQPLLWRDAAQLVLLLVGVPSAFLLWLFRDINVSGTLANQRKDVNLKEFQEIQMRAAGAMDEKLPASARETLQIAALHQLRAFLRGEYGASFRRPAFELLRARLVASAEVTGTQAVHDWLERWRQAADTDESDLSSRIEGMKREVRGALRVLNPSRVAETERLIIHEEWEAIFRSGLPLSGSIFDRLWLSGNAVLADLELSGCRFVGTLLPEMHFENAMLVNADFAFAFLPGVHFERAQLVGAHFEGAQLYRAHCERANLGRAHLDGADLEYAHLEEASCASASFVGANLQSARLRNAHLGYADLRGADVSRADMTGARLAGAQIEGAIMTVDPLVLAGCKSATFDDATAFASNWSDLSDGQRDYARAPWIERGAVRTDE